MLNRLAKLIEKAGQTVPPEAPAASEGPAEPLPVIPSVPLGSK
jgi:hypothetical protein